MTRTCHWLKTTFSSRKSFDCICRTHATHQQSISLYISLHKSQLVLIRLWLKFQDRQKNSRIQKIANKSNGPGWASSIDLVLSETNHCRTKEKPTLLPLQHFEKFTLLHLEYDKKNTISVFSTWNGCACYLGVPLYRDSPNWDSEPWLPQVARKCMRRLFVHE